MQVQANFIEHPTKEAHEMANVGRICLYSTGHGGDCFVSRWTRQVTINQAILKSTLDLLYSEEFRFKMVQHLPVEAIFASGFSLIVNSSHIWIWGIQFYGLASELSACSSPVNFIQIVCFYFPDLRYDLHIQNREWPLPGTRCIIHNNYCMCGLLVTS